MSKKKAETPKGEPQPTGAGDVPAKRTQVTLPPIGNIIDAANRGELTTEQGIVAFRDWYAAYFTQVFRTYTRETVGKKISPGDWHMKKALDMLPAGACHLPPHERAKCFFPLEMLLRAIADAWEDAAAPALSAAYHWGEVKRFHVDEYGDGTEPIPTAKAQEKIDEVNGHLRDMKAELNKLAAQLLNANTDDLKRILADAVSKVTAAARRIATTANQVDVAVYDLKNTNREFANASKKMQGTIDGMRTVANDVRAGRKAAETAAEQSRLAADGTTRIEEYTQDLKPAVDGLYEILNAEAPGAHGTKDVNTNARAAILKLYDDFMAGELDRRFPERKGRHTAKQFIDLCGELVAYTKKVDGTTKTVNECLPGGVQQLKGLIHTRDQERHAAK